MMFIAAVTQLADFALACRDRAAPVPDCRPSVSSLNGSDYFRHELWHWSDGVDLDADQAHVSHLAHSGVTNRCVSLG
jgi:hypothetical protein